MTKSALSLLLLIVSLLVGACRPAAMAAPSSPAEVSPRLTAAERAEEMSVALLDWEDGSPNCGGVWVSQRKIVTAFHCVSDNGRPAAAANPLLEALGIALPTWDPTGQMEGYQVKGDKAQYNSKIATFDRDRDLALLEVVGDAPKHASAKVRTRPLRDGEELDVVGSTIGLPFSYSRCFVGAAAREWKVQVSGPIYYGNSGGGAFDEAGDLVGVALSMRAKSDGTVVPDLSFFAGPGALTSFLGNS